MRAWLCAVLLLLPAAAAAAPAAAEKEAFQEAMTLYQGLIARHPKDRKLWWELVYALADRKRHREAASWLERYRKAFPDDPRAVEELIGLYEASGDPPSALRLMREELGKKPHDRKKADRLAQALLSLQFFDEAAALAVDRLRAEPDDAGWLAILAEARFQTGHPQEAADCLRRLLARPPPQPPAQVLYRLSELAASLGEKESARKLAALALDKARSPNALGERERLRLEARLSWSGAIELRYHELASRRTRDASVLTDWIDGLLEHGRGERGEEALFLLRRRFPRSAAADRYRYERDSRQGDWPAAALSAQAWLERKPSDREALRALGESAYMCGSWRSSREAIAAIPPLDRPCYLREIAWDVSRHHEHMAAAGLRYYQLPDDITRQEDVELRFARGRMVWEGRARRGRYRVASRGFRRDIGDGEIRAAYEGLHPLSLSLAAAGTAGFSRNVISPTIAADYGGAGRPSLRASYRHHGFWNEQSLPVAEGALSDEAQVSAEHVLGRVYARAEYQYNHYTLAGGPRADRGQFRPQLGFILLPGGFCSGPYASVGYRFLLDDVAGQDGFFARLPLQRRSRTHCAAAALSHWWRPGVLQTELSGDACRDADRGLAFGDLFSASARLRWAVRPWLDALTGYDYGRESSLTGTGLSHNVIFRLEAHWDGRHDRAEDMHH